MSGHSNRLDALLFRFTCGVLGLCAWALCNIYNDLKTTVTESAARISNVAERFSAVEERAVGTRADISEIKAALIRRR